MKKIIISILSCILIFSLTSSAFATSPVVNQEEQEISNINVDNRISNRISNLESQLNNLEFRLEKIARNNAEEGLVLFLFGAFCALWAQNTGRNSWSWFFMGLIFNFITVLVLLRKNSEDNQSKLSL